MESLVIGGGVIGVCCAYYLHQEGYSVTVIDQGGIGSGCSRGNAGLIVPSHTIPLARPGVITQGLRWLLDRQSPFYVKPRLDPALWSWLWHFRQASRADTARRGASALGRLAQASSRLTKDLIVSEELACDYLEKGVMQVFRTAAALKEAVQHTEGRHVFGLPLSTFQATQFKIAEMATRIRAARNLYYEAAWFLDQGKPDSALIAMAKQFCTEMAIYCADEALQMHGGYGYIDEFKVQRLYRDAKALELYEGSKELELVSGVMDLGMI